MLELSDFASVIARSSGDLTAPQSKTTKNRQSGRFIVESVYQVFRGRPTRSRVRLLTAQIRKPARKQACRQGWRPQLGFTAWLIISQLCDLLLYSYWLPFVLPPGSAATRAKQAWMPIGWRRFRRA